ncbi:MAG: hypothetical protein WCG91_00810 [Candidatus Shapirobacteria bacterium]
MLNNSKYNIFNQKYAIIYRMNEKENYNKAHREIEEILIKSIKEKTSPEDRMDTLDKYLDDLENNDPNTFEKLFKSENNQPNELMKINQKYFPNKLNR